MHLAESDKRGLLERNNSFMQKRDTKIAKELPTGMSQCTFRPRVLKPNKEKQSTGNIVGRLYSYLEFYEKRKAEYKHNL